jgi:hypothetical protein
VDWINLASGYGQGEMVWTALIWLRTWTRTAGVDWIDLATGYGQLVWTGLTWLRVTDMDRWCGLDLLGYGLRTGTWCGLH